MKMFKPGTKVVCINEGGVPYLQLGSVYTVERNHRSVEGVKLAEFDGFWFKSHLFAQVEVSR